jgi:acyl-coenzyme A thioesterase PaaI-like protein
VTTATGRDGARAEPDRRTAAAGALRRLGHALVAHDAAPDLLAELEETVQRWVGVVEGGPVRRRTVEAYLDDLDRPMPPDGGAVEHFADCPVSGLANPLGIALQGVRDGPGVRCLIRLGAAFEGAPGRAHGGIVAAIFDDAMGFVVSMMGLTAYQGELTIRYLAPTPMRRELEVRAWPIERTGRRLIIDGTISCDGAETARARGIHVIVDRDRVGVPTP